MDVQTAIEVQDLTKRYRQHTVIKGISFKVNPGEVYALVGPNGAGKTTVIRLVTGLAFPTSGKVTLLGLDPFEKPSVRHKLGAVVEAPAAFYPYLSGRENLRLHARLAGRVPETRIRDVLQMMELSDAAERPVGIYSLGMRQRLGVAAALLTKPEVLILDEPASGMDPLSLHLVHSVLKRSAEEGTAVLLSTHHLDEVVAYCSRVAIMEDGRFVDEVNLLDRRQRYRARVSDPERALAVLEEADFTRHVSLRHDEVIMILSDAEKLGQVAELLTQHQLYLYELVRDTFDLRSYYREQIHEKQSPVQRLQSMIGKDEDVVHG